jgi:maltooligosyltrehalose trehalohydrolase
VALTGQREAYFTDYAGSPQEFISALKYGFLYQGQWYSWQHQKRGEQAFGLPGECFVHFLENHDQVANSRDGLRRHVVADPGRFRALTALLLLGPATPLLFQGQEYGASAPFLYFADHTGELAALVEKGRREFLSQFASLAREPREAFSDPAARATFDRSKLDPSERARHPQAVALHASLLELRRTDATFRSRGAHGIDGALIDGACGVLRFFGDPAALDGPADRLLLFNLGHERELLILPEPLLAPPGGCDWSIRWSSEDPAYGGQGVPDLRTASGGWRLAGESATVLIPVRENGR